MSPNPVRAASAPSSPATTGPFPRWLDEGEQQVWRTFLHATGQFRDALDRQLQRDTAMPHSYYEILATLSEAPDRRMRMSQLADLLLSSRSRLSHAVKRLEELGWVARHACPEDKRGQIATLTLAGFDVLEAAAPGHVEAVRTYLFDPLSPEQVDQLGTIFAAVLAGLEADAGSPDERTDRSC